MPQRKFRTLKEVIEAVTADTDSCDSEDEPEIWVILGMWILNYYTDISCVFLAGARTSEPLAILKLFCLTYY